MTDPAQPIRALAAQCGRTGAGRCARGDPEGGRPQPRRDRRRAEPFGRRGTRRPPLDRRGVPGGDAAARRMTAVADCAVGVTAAGRAAPTPAPAPAPTRLEFRSVTKRFPMRGGRPPSGRPAARHDHRGRGPDLRAQRRTRWSRIIGPSGCGKSTCLGMASGLDRPSAGEVQVDGEPVDGPNEHVAFMLQKDLLLPWRTIRQNVEFGQEIRGIERAERRERANALLARFRLAEFRGQLSPSDLRRHGASARRWPARWPTTPTSCCSTNRSRRSTRRPRWCCSATWPPRWPNGARPPC